MTRFYKDEDGKLWDNQNTSEAVMADSAYEEQTYQEFIDNAKGDVLIGGWGIRWVNDRLQQKPEVTSITTVEKHQEVIDLTPMPKNLAKPETLIHADFLEYVPTKDYDTIYVDLWNSGKPEDNPPKIVNGMHPYDACIERLKPFLKEGGWIGKWHRL